MENVGLVTCGNTNYSAFVMGALDFFVEKGISFPHIISSQRTTNAVLNFVSGQKGRCLAATEKEIGKRGGIISWINGSNDKKAEPEIVKFDVSAYFSSQTLHEFALTDCSNGKAVYFSEKKSEEKLTLLALAAMCEPITSKEVKIGNSYYFNGSFSDPLLLRGMAKTDCKKQLVILSEPLTMQHRIKPSICSLYSLVFRKYPNFCGCVNSYNTLLDKQLAALKQAVSSKMLYVLQPDVDFMNRNSSLRQLYQHGYTSAEKHCREIEEFIGGGK